MSMYYISFSCFVFTCFDFVFLSQNLNIINFSFFLGFCRNNDEQKRDKVS